MRTNQIITLVVLVLFIASPVVCGAQSVRVIPTKGSSVKVIENGKENTFTSEIPLPDGAKMVCTGECVVQGPGYQFIASDGAKFSVKLLTDRDRDALVAVITEAGRYTFTMQPNTQFTINGITFTSGNELTTFSITEAGVTVSSGSLAIAGPAGVTTLTAGGTSAITASALATGVTGVSTTTLAIAGGIAAAVAGGTLAATSLSKSSVSGE